MRAATTERWRAVIARFVAVWRTDFVDPASMARLRARVLLWTAAGALIVIVGDVLRAGKGGWTIGPLLVAAVLVWYRGARMGDLTFALMMYIGYPAAALGGIAADPVAAIPVVAISSMISTTFVALFVQRAAFAYAGIALAVTTVSVVAAVVPSRPGIAADYTGSVLVLVVVGVAMRLVRDLAVSALVQSRRLEATDALTDMPNRRGLERSGLDLWQRAARTRTRLSVLVLDIDHFKRINDEEGHAAGDEVLRRMGALLNGHTRADDLMARLGGEEFAVLATCAPDSVEVFAERLRRLIETEMAPVTVSIGVYTQLPVEEAAWPAALWEMVNHADHALYRAKAAGRNQVVLTADHDRLEPEARAVLPTQRLAQAAVNSDGPPAPGSATMRRRADAMQDQPSPWANERRRFRSSRASTI